MKSKLGKMLITLVAGLCTTMALSISASACIWGFYQPEEPECLRVKAE